MNKPTNPLAGALRKGIPFIIGFWAIDQLKAVYGQQGAENLVRKMERVTKELKALENDPFLKLAEGQLDFIAPQSESRLIATAALHKKEQLTQKLKSLENALNTQAQARLATLE